MDKIVIRIFGITVAAQGIYGVTVAGAVAILTTLLLR